MILLPGFVKSEGLDMVQVSYRNAGLGMQDTVSGRIHVVMTSLTTALPLVRTGKLRLLAVTNKHRAPLAPDVPTAIEAGYPQLAFDGLQGFFGSRNMPAERRDRIAADISAVAADPAVADPLTALGLVAAVAALTQPPPDEEGAELSACRAFDLKPRIDCGTQRRPTGPGT